MLRAFYGERRKILKPALLINATQTAARLDYAHVFWCTLGIDLFEAAARIDRVLAQKDIETLESESSDTGYVEIASLLNWN